MKFSPVIAGCMKWGRWGAGFDTAGYQQIINTCAVNKITSFDHADIYGDYTTEEEFGKALVNMPGVRQHVQLITKCGIKMVGPQRPEHHIKSYDTSKEYIIRCADRSLKNLHTDYLDLFLIHRPDPLMNPHEIAEALTHLKNAGKVLHSGVSNFTPSQVAMLHALIPVEVNQLEISVTALDPFHNGQLDQCQQLNIRPMAWAPLGGGNLFSDKPDEKTKRILAAAEELGKKYNISADNILLSFLHTHPAGIIPVLGTAKSIRLADALKAAGVKLEREDWFRLWEASKGHPVP